MKPFFIIFIVLLSSSVFAERVTLFENQSFLDDGKNITLLGIDHRRDKALFCVNNEQAIVADGAQKTVNQVSLSVKSLSSEKVRVEIDNYCKDCKCDVNCLNLECTKAVVQIQENINEEIETEIIEEENVVILSQNEELVENQGLSTANVLLALGILIAFSFALYYLIKK